MNEENQLIELARAEGWTIKKRPCPTSRSVTQWFWYKPGSDLFKEDYQTSTQVGFPSLNRAGNPIPEILPDYLNDLNAIRKVEKTVLISSDLWEDYLDNHLPIICERDLINPAECASASQRAEGLLKALGKWEHKS